MRALSVSRQIPEFTRMKTSHLAGLRHKILQRIMGEGLYQKVRSDGETASCSLDFATTRLITRCRLFGLMNPKARPGRRSLEGIQSNTGGRHDSASGKSFSNYKIKRSDG